MVRISKEPDIRCQELLDIGLSLYFEIGAKGISIQKVVEKANVATGLFYYYFKSKDQFLNEVLNVYIEKEIMALEEILKRDNILAVEKLDMLLNAYFEYAKKMIPHRS